MWFQARLQKKIKQSLHLDELWISFKNKYKKHVKKHKKKSKRNKEIKKGKIAKKRAFCCFFKTEKIHLMCTPALSSRYDCNLTNVELRQCVQNRLVVICVRSRGAEGKGRAAAADESRPCCCGADDWGVWEGVGMVQTTPPGTFPCKPGRGWRDGGTHGTTCDPLLKDKGRPP